MLYEGQEAIDEAVLPLMASQHSFLSRRSVVNLEVVLYVFQKYIL
mgnify:CR=1 FL=1